MILSLEHLKKMRERYHWNGVSEVTVVLDELIAIRELKGDKVPYGYYSAETATILKQQGHASISAEPLADSRFPLFTAPQKPVELPPVEKWRKSDEVRAQNAYRILVEKEIKAAGGKVAE